MRMYVANLPTDATEGEIAAARKAAVDLCWTRAKLTQWGRKCRALGTGFPSMSTTEKARIGRGGRFSGPALPPDLEEIDVIVSRAPKHHQAILVEAYTKSGSGSQHAGRLRFSLRDYWRRKTEAEEHVRDRLQVLALEV
jgi:hypothetical protein